MTTLFDLVGYVFLGVALLYGVMLVGEGFIGFIFGMFQGINSDES